MKQYIDDETYNIVRPFNITIPKGRRLMFDLPEKKDKVGELLKVQGEVINEMYHERLYSKRLVDPSPLRKKIVGYRLRDMFPSENISTRVSGDTLEEAIDNLVKRDKERGEEIERLKKKNALLEDMHESIKLLLHMKPGETAIGERIQELTERVLTRAAEAKSYKGLYLTAKARASKLNAEKRKLMELLREPNEKIDREYRAKKFWVVDDDVIEQYKAWLKQRKVK